MSIASEIERLQDAKADIKTAIEAKGVTIPSSATLDDYGTYIEHIPSGGSSRDWSEIGYSEEPEEIQDSFDYSKEIYDNWDATITNRANAFSGTTGSNENLLYFPNVDTSNITIATSMFTSSNVQELGDDFDFSSITDATSMFQGSKIKHLKDVLLPNNCKMGKVFYNCSSLKEIDKLRLNNTKTSNNDILYNISGLKINKLIMYYSQSGANNNIRNMTNLDILEMVNENNIVNIGSKNIFSNCTFTDRAIDQILIYLKTLSRQSSSNKTLKVIGFTSANCDQAVLSSHWQDLVNAGWTTGY